MREQGCLINAQSLAANVTSAAIQFDNVNKMSIQNILTGSPVGILYLECSNDLVHDGADVTNWQTYHYETISAASMVMFTLEDTIKWYRIKYVFTSGTGSITSNFYSVTEGN